MATNIFTELEGKLPPSSAEISQYSNPSEFEKLVHARRSVRKFCPQTVIPIEVSRQCLELGLLAPNSSNLQTWEFILVRDPKLKAELATYCYNQSAARTASELVVCIGRTDNALSQSQKMLQFLEKSGQVVPKAAKDYYTKITPLVYRVGPFSLYAPLKWLLYTLIGLKNVTVREPVTQSDLRTWALKSCALAAENIMLAYRSFGYDTCPMEGFDRKRVAAKLKLTSHQHIAMILGVGKGLPEGIYGERVRFPSDEFITIL